MLGALETRRDSLASLPETGGVEIPAEQWIPFLDSFSRQHQDWLVTITITQRDEKQTEVRERPLLGISSDHLSASDEIYFSAVSEDGSHITHPIKNPMKLVFQRNLEGAHEGLEITSADGTHTSLHFRTATLPETLDGLLEESRAKVAHHHTIGKIGRD